MAANENGQGECIANGDDDSSQNENVATHGEEGAPSGTVKRCVRNIEFETMEMVEGMDSLSMGDATKVNNNGIGDGNDSGIDTGVTPITVGTLQRALSSNSAGYASSSGGGDVAIFASCNSSLLSVCSELYDGKTLVGGTKPINDCTSEGGSESSSLSNGPTTSKRHASPKKRVVMADLSASPPTRSPKKSENPVARTRTRAASANRAAAQRSSGAPMLATTERARSREKQNSVNANGSNATTMMTRSASMRRPIKPDSLPTNLRDMASPSMQRVTALSRTPSITRRTPSNCTPSTEDGRWPSVGARNTRRLGTPDNLVIKTKIGPIILENKSSGADKCATLPRRRKEKSEEDLRQLGRSNRSNSVTRDQRMTSSAIMRRSTKESTPQKTQSHPPRGRKLATTKTMIYHETAVQTALTSHDIDDAFAGTAKEIHVNAITTANKDIQVDIRDREIERLEERLRQLTGENVKLQQDLEERAQSLNAIEQQLARERDEKSAMKQELMSNTERVLSMLQLVHAPTHAIPANGDGLLMLESQIQLSEHALEEKQTEINTLRSFCGELQAEMNRSLHVQQSLVEERKCFEKESTELQDFLQDEKTAIVEALKEAETEIEQHRALLKAREQDVERLQDECRHLVRISEQRRQEYLGMQSKYTALESKSKDMIVQQNNAVSGATIALSDLGSRLSSLVEQLVVSYSLSEQEIEDVIYHNEAYPNSSEEPSPEFERVTEKGAAAGHEDSLSPQRNRSFIAAVINAIRSAANTAKQSVHKKSIGDLTPTFGDDLESDSTEMLDSETEPCLMMENVLEDVSMPDSHSHNMVSSTNSLVMVTAPSANDMNKDEESLHNLCEAIANRKKIEQQANMMMMQHRGVDCEQSNSDEAVSESIADVPSISENCTVQHLVDHVINVDNLVTKLLKVLRLIQMENDNCVQRLICEKNKLQLNKEDLLEKMKDWEHTNMKLKSDLGVASEQLLINCDELANSKMELQRRRNEINKLNEDICRLSTLCTQNQKSVTQSPPQDVILNAFKNWQESKDISDLNLFVRANEDNVTSSDNENQSTAITSNSVNCQNEAITKAIETLNGIQSIVAQCPALADLQRDLELMLPADCNANDTSSDPQSISTDSAINQSIDLSA